MDDVGGWLIVYLLFDDKLTNNKTMIENVSKT